MAENDAKATNQNSAAPSKENQPNVPQSTGDDAKEGDKAKDMDSESPKSDDQQVGS